MQSFGSRTSPSQSSSSNDAHNYKLYLDGRDVDTYCLLVIKLLFTVFTEASFSHNESIELVRILFKN